MSYANYSNLPDGVTESDIEKAYGWGEEPDPDWIEVWIERNGDEIVERLMEATPFETVLSWLERRVQKYPHDYAKVAEWWSDKYAFDAMDKGEEELFNEAKTACLSDPEPYQEDLKELYFNSEAFDTYMNDVVNQEAEEAYYNQKDDFDEPFDCDEGFAFARY